MAKENNLAQDPVGSLVWRIALPSMLAQFVNVLYSIVDRMYVGNIAGTGSLALAGVGICGPIVTMIGSIASLVGVGGAPMMSIQLGAGHREHARKILSNAFLLMTVFSITVTLILVPLQEPMLRLFGASNSTLPYALDYFSIYLCGTLFALMASGMNQFIICQGFAVTGMKSVILGAVCNIALDPVFIFGLGMGVRGAALATILSQAASALYVLHFLFGPRTGVRIGFGGYDLRTMGRILLMGFTPFVIIAVDNVMIIAMNALLQRYGGVQGDMLVTANAIVQSFMLVLTMPLGGISGGTQSILSYNYGANQPDRVLKAQRYIAGLCVGFSAMMFLLARAAGPLFTSMFTGDPQVAEIAQRAIRISTLSVIPLGVQYAIVDGFTAMGQVQLSLPLSFWRKIVYFVAIFALPAAFGAEAAFYAEPVSDFIGPLTGLAIYLLCIRKVLSYGRRVVLPEQRKSTAK